jgi:large conductance mechanosensitive channel
MGMLKEFKAFAMKGNLVDIAVGFVMGAAFKQVVTSFTGGIVSPLIGLLVKSDLKDLKWVIEPATETTKEVAVLYGNFITNVIDFIIVAFVMFMMIKGINAAKKKEEPAPPPPPAGPTQEELLAEIRDLLAKNKK